MVDIIRQNLLLIWHFWGEILSGWEGHIHDQKFCPDTGRSLSDRPETGRFLKIARFEPEKCQKASSWVPIVVFEHSFV